MQRVLMQIARREKREASSRRERGFAAGCGMDEQPRVLGRIFLSNTEDQDRHGEDF